MPYDAKTGKHYDYTEEGIEQYKKETGRGMPMKKTPMKNTAYFKAKYFSSPNKLVGQDAMANDTNSMASIEGQDPISKKIDQKVEEKVDEVVNQKTGEGLV